MRFLGSSSDYLIHDQQGQLIKLDLNKRVVDRLMIFHSGPISSVDTSPLYHKMASLGLDGTIRFYDYTSKQMTEKISFPQGGTAMCYLPACIDSAGNTLAAGFQDGVLRILSSTKDGVNLQYVFKPHRAAITNITISDDGTLLVTGSEDKTLFFFNLTRQAPASGKVTPFTRYSIAMQPVGFVTLLSPISNISISPEDTVSRSPFGFQKEKGNKSVGFRLLLNLKDGNLLTGMIPNGFNFDSSTTFEIPASRINLKPWMFDIKEQEMAAAAAAQAVYEAQNVEVSRPNSAGSKKSDKEKQPEEQVKPTPKEIKLSLNSLRKAEGLQLNSEGKIYTVSFLKQGYFLAAVENKKGECEVRMCHILAPTFSKLIVMGIDPVSKLHVSKCNKFVLIGTNTGQASMIKFNMIEFLGPRPVNEHETYAGFVEKFGERIENYQITLKALNNQMGDIALKDQNLTRISLTGQKWSGCIHDIVSGRITSVITSFDDSYMVTSSNDGGLFVWRLIQETTKENPELSDNLSEQSNQFNCPEDIIDPTTYSIQESKMKSERDKEIELADGKKQLVRNAIQELRNEYLALMADNEKLIPEKRAHKSQLSVDPYLERDIELEKKEKISNLQKELAWNTEREAIGPRKLRQKFLDVLQQETIEVKAFKSQKSVSTFRHLKLDDYVKQYLKLLYAVQIDNDRDHYASLSEDIKIYQEKSAVEAYSQETGFNSKKKQDVTSGNKLEERKKNRAARTQIWKKLMDCKPDEKYEDPKDVAAIRYAESHMGDYKLKSADNYIVPESERIDADKKTKQIMLLRESINTIQENFNSQVLTIRSKKAAIVRNFEENIKVIKKINSELETLGVSVVSFEWRPVLEVLKYKFRNLHFQNIGTM